MPIMDERYRKLNLSDECLSDPLLMALAWKKSHEYIRSHNWYADTFELDVSSIDLPSRCKEWAKDVSGELEFAELELVPAPKTQKWTFEEPSEADIYAPFKVIWKPESSSAGAGKPADGSASELRLRPLAHIGIREQTIMTLLSMCLADDVETLQGDPSMDYEEVHAHGVVSYGNRLFCRYEKGKAEHSYGATTTYSKFFTDYQRFLSRPYFFAKKEVDETSNEETVYLLELDVSKFFDRVNRGLLSRKIRNIVLGQPGLDEGKGSCLENILSAFERWEWSLSAMISFKRLCTSKDVPEAPTGLPQGLVASGFLANIYMAEFDQYMVGLLGRQIETETGITLVDYCRYVDDMRLVVRGPSSEAIKRKHGKDANYVDEIKRAVCEVIQKQLDPLDLVLNPKKSKAEVFRGKAVGISASLQNIQQNVSGPVSIEDAEVHLGQLESILSLSEDSAPQQDGSEGRYNRLAGIEKDMFDVREDTLKRFAANKIGKLLSEIRDLSYRSIGENGGPEPGSWDYLQERLARRFIACWSRDPSLVLLLKKGVELFPSPALLNPIIQQLEYLINLESQDFTDHPENEKKGAVGAYCLAEIFRHAATVIHRKDKEKLPAHADVNAFFEILQSCAVRHIGSTEFSSSPDFLKAPRGSEDFDLLAMQGRFLLLVRLDTTLESPSGCAFHDLIFKLATGFRGVTLPKSLSARELAASILIAGQLVRDRSPLFRATDSIFSNYPEPIVILEMLAAQDADLFRALIIYSRSIGSDWVKSDVVRNLASRMYVGVRPSTKPLAALNGSISLYKLISRPDNPFANEIMALKLLKALLKERLDFDGAKPGYVVDLAKTKVQFSTFSCIPTVAAFDEELEVKVGFSPGISVAADHLVSGDKDTFALQRAALCVRSALSGSDDPTGFGDARAPLIGYRGLKSTRFKRQIGLMTTPEALAGASAQFSGWLTTLLSKMLRWPGIRVNSGGYDWPRELDRETVTELIESRLIKLKGYYCLQSGIPGLAEVITPDWADDKQDLIVSMVQTKMPSQEDFGNFGLYLDAPDYRVRHRRHVARVSKLVVQHIQSQHTKKPENGEREKDIDLIVFPELAVHQQDIDVLVRLSRKTHAIVVAGLGFIDLASQGPVNCALWIVPRKHNGNRNEVQRLQGKQHMTAGEKELKIRPWRPYQLMLEILLPGVHKAPGFMLTASICYDATDIRLSADLRDKSDALLIPALNRDVNTFDSMVEALHYHMYQHVVLVNTGEYGGSYAMAPYEQRHDRLIAHSTGKDQVAINTFRMNMFDFRRDNVGASMKSGKKRKAAPAGIDQ